MVVLTLSIKSEQIMSTQTIKYINQLLFGDYLGNSDSQTGYDAFTLLSKPQALYGYMPMEYETGVLGRVYFKQVKLSPSLPVGKQGAEGTFTLDMTTPKLPVLVLPDDSD